MKILLNYLYSDNRVETTGGGHPADFPGATVVRGPTTSSLGRLPKAIRLAGTTSARTRVDDLALPLRKFCVRAVFQPVGKVTSRQNVAESSRFPFALFIDKGASDSTLTVVASVHTKHYGWRQVDSRFRSPAIRTNRWLSVDMVYDQDTLALFINGQIADVQALPRGALEALRGNELFIGSWIDGRRNRFAGDLAALQLIDGAPEDLEARLDEARSEPIWHISRKRIDAEASYNLGSEAGPVRFDAQIDAYWQEFQRGRIMYHDSIGVAFEMHGVIWAFYKRYARKSALGYLVTDEGNSTKRGARKSLFSKGGIYWSRGTGAQPVVGQIYLDYENLGEAAAIGLPQRAETNVSGGKVQIFEHARMYQATGAARAHEVHGAILSRFLATGGVRRWGFPVTDEVDVLRGGSSAGSSTVIGKSSEVQGATFFWSSRTGAFEVHGDIRRKYLELDGPAGKLGFPTSDERDISGASGSKMNTFHQGSICWYGHYNSIVVARPFKIFVGRVATRESEGYFGKQNDLYVYIRASDGSQTYDRRHPGSGNWGGHNSHNINITIRNRFVPNHANYTVDFRFKCMDSDRNRDDHLGTFNKRLNAANGWGLRERNGVYNNSFSKVRSLTWSVKPQVDIASLSETDKWWGVNNRGTNNISYKKYSRAFRDVDSDTEWWEVTDWLEKAFYELVIDDFAKKGNCFGMSLEGIYARKNRSVFGFPLDRFKTWSTVESELNIKHCYQVGAQAIWWFVGQFITGNTHDPKDVFVETRDAFRRGEHPVICIAQNWDFSGGPHCILPVGWHQSRTVWKIDILDPNFRGQLRELTVNRRNNTFRYVGSRTYTGGEWSGGRFHYMPYDILDSLPRTPIWDAILLLLAGTVVIFAGDAESVSIQDGAGHDLDAFGSRARARQQAGDPIEEYFVSYRGFAGEAVGGGLMFRRNPLRGSGDIRRDGALAAHTSIDTVARIRSRSTQPLATAMRAAPPSVRTAMSGRTAHAILADAILRPRLSTELVESLSGLAAANREGTFKHKLRGKRNGSLQYGVCAALMAARLDTVVRQGEMTDVGVNDLSSSKQQLSLTSPSDKLVNLVYETRLGVGKDRVEVKFERMAAAANKPLSINLRPGVGGVDLVSHGQRVDVQVSMKAQIAGRMVQRRYIMPVEGGVRFSLGVALDEGDLTVNRIDRLFGRPGGVIVLRSR